jgi:phage shock protein C
MRSKAATTSKNLYRSRNGVILGVCRGLAEYFDFSVFWTRFIAFMGLFFSGLGPILGIYLLAGLLIKLEPVIPIDTDGEREFYDSYTTSRSRAAQRVKERYDRLERRLRRLEDHVTAKSFEWNDRFNS